MKVKQTPLVLTGIAFLALLSSFLFSAIQPQTAQAYKCKDSHYYDPGDQVCRSYKEETPITKADGSITCPSGGQPSDGKCWVRGGDKQNYAPTRDDGSEIPAGEISCGTYHVAGTPIVDPDGEDLQTHYYADRYSCCAQTVGGAINPTRCVDPDVPDKDPTTDKVQQCSSQGGVMRGGACVWESEEQCKRRGEQAVWVADEDSGNHTCRLYSDFSSRESCEKVGGEFKVTGKNSQGQDVWTCVKPGTNPQTADPADGSNTGTGGQATDTGTCGQATTNLISCTGSGVQAIGDVLRQIIVILTILIGIAAVGGIAYAAVLYASATDNASQTQNAISLLRNIVIGILVYGFMVAIINWLVPGGVIG